ncbi:hypothetical protein F0L74_25465 [Chitinophaga agrisoli]|uniref:Carboxypeptidase family protein n=1 Tax=Chitinophaga agrisoli TaxID=2607653 RepID=A0A5B2VKE8_9BACT|nr:hypothetical protein [Chitinophaga agrisoli]KAA2239551.1 hypothetical protein F0L74_25465 [Chitinophaga agrisoli]
MKIVNTPVRGSLLFILLPLILTGFVTKAQYVEKERDDTVRIYCQTRFDTLEAKKALARGTGAIKGVAFTRPVTGTYGFKSPLVKRMFANKMKVFLFPLTPYMEEYISLKKKKEKPKKLRYVYMDPNAWRFRLEAITNSDGEFTFPDMKPGKYYVKGILNWTTTGYYNEYTGSGYDGYGQINYFERKYYDVNHADLLEEYVEVKEEGEVVKIKLK